MMLYTICQKPMIIQTAIDDKTLVQFPKVRGTALEKQEVTLARSQIALPFVYIVATT